MIPKNLSGSCSICPWTRILKNDIDKPTISKPTPICNGKPTINTFICGTVLATRPSPTLIKNKIAISESGFIFDPTSGDSYSLNPIAAEIANMIKEEVQEEEIKFKILEKYDVDEATYEKDFYDFKNMLLQYNLTD